MTSFQITISSLLHRRNQSIIVCYTHNKWLTRNEFTIANIRYLRAPNKSSEKSTRAREYHFFSYTYIGIPPKRLKLKFLKIAFIYSPENSKGIIRSPYVTIINTLRVTTKQKLIPSAGGYIIYILHATHCCYRLLNKKW